MKLHAEMMSMYTNHTNKRRQRLGLNIETEIYICCGNQNISGFNGNELNERDTIHLCLFSSYHINKKVYF